MRDDDGTRHDHGAQADGRPDARSDARAAARIKAEEGRRRARRRERATVALVKGGSAVVALALVTTVAAVLVASASSPTGSGPANTAADGVRIGTGLVAERSPARAVDAEPDASPTPGASDVADIAVYVDYHCPGCAQFELENADYLTGLVESGAATVQIHPLSVTDRSSLGSRYATRAAASAACVADLEPDGFWAVNQALFAAQPDPGSRGHSIEGLARIVDEAHPFDDPSAVAECVADQRFAGWVTAATSRALAGPLPYDSVEAITSTPTAFVNGELFDPEIQSFPEFVASTLGEAYAAETAGGVR